MIKRVITDQLPSTIHLIGEISNCCRHASGHLYLTLKDDRSEIRAVMWRSSVTSMKFKPADGMSVIATGSIDVYESRGQYQFLIRQLEPRGAGTLDLAFRQLRDRLTKEGLFEPARKKAIPRFPQRVAVVTSPTGAAIRDILKTLKRRYPCATVLLHPVRVQGEGSAEEISAAIRRLNAQAARLGGIDTLIVARGGGSLEDLWSFNEEIVARAIFDSTIPVISGVGHEVDITIADLVADLRAPTPTAAAELAVPVLDEMAGVLSAQASRLHRALVNRLDRSRSRLEAVERFDWFRDPLGALRRHEQRLDELTSRLRLCCGNRLSAARRRLHELEMLAAAVQPIVVVRRYDDRLTHMAHRLRWALVQHLHRSEARIQLVTQRLASASPQRTIDLARERVDALGNRLEQACERYMQLARRHVDFLEARLEATSYRQTLARGFSITRLYRGRRIITNAQSVAPGDRIVTETADGSFESKVTDSKQGELFD